MLILISHMNIEKKEDILLSWVAFDLIWCAT